MSGIEATALERFSVLAFDADLQYSWDAGNPVVRKSNDQPEISLIVVTPDERWTNPVADASVDAVEPRRRCFVVTRQQPGINVMEVPQRPVIRADVHDMRNHVFRRRDSSLH